MTIQKTLGEESGTRWRIFRKMQLPGALPYIISSMEVDPVLVREFIASDRKLDYSTMQVKAIITNAAMFMAVIMLTFLPTTLFAMMRLLKPLVVKESRFRSAPA